MTCRASNMTSVATQGSLHVDETDTARSPSLSAIKPQPLFFNDFRASECAMCLSREEHVPNFYFARFGAVRELRNASFEEAVKGWDEAETISPANGGGEAEESN